MPLQFTDVRKQKLLGSRQSFRRCGAAGIDHERLAWRHSGRDFRLTDVFGRVIDPILA